MPIPILFAIGSLIAQFFGALRRAWSDPASRGLMYSVFILILLGTFVFHVIEGWGWIDSLYFTVITLTTVGYGDFAPQTSVGKLFTVIYIILWLGLLASFITMIATHNRESMQERLHRRRAKRGQTDTEESNDEEPKEETD